MKRTFQFLFTILSLIIGSNVYATSPLRWEVVDNYNNQTKGSQTIKMDLTVGSGSFFTGKVKIGVTVKSENLPVPSSGTYKLNYDYTDVDGAHSGTIDFSKKTEELVVHAQTGKWIIDGLMQNYFDMNWANAGKVRINFTLVAENDFNQPNSNLSFTADGKGIIAGILWKSATIKWNNLSFVKEGSNTKIDCSGFSTITADCSSGANIPLKISSPYYAGEQACLKIACKQPTELLEMTCDKTPVTFDKKTNTAYVPVTFDANGTHNCLVNVKSLPVCDGTQNMEFAYTVIRSATIDKQWGTGYSNNVILNSGIALTSGLTDNCNVSAEQKTDFNLYVNAPCLTGSKGMVKLSFINDDIAQNADIYINNQKINFSAGVGYYPNNYDQNGGFEINNNSLNCYIISKAKGSKITGAELSAAFIKGKTNHLQADIQYGETVSRKVNLETPKSTTGIDDAASGNDIKLYPNPLTDGTLNIKSGNATISRVTIIDLNGRLIHDQSYDNTEISIPVTWAKGAYIVKMTTDTGNIITSRIIKL